MSATLCGCHEPMVYLTCPHGVKSPEPIKHLRQEQLILNGLVILWVMLKVFI